MSTEATKTAGGFAGNPLDALNAPTAVGGCCGSAPAAPQGEQSGGCCGTSVAEAPAQAAPEAGSCCG